MNTKNETSSADSKNSGKTTDSSMSSHEKHVEAGRKGGEARAEHMHENNSAKSQSSKSDKSDTQSSHEKHVEAGRKGGEAKAANNR